MAEDFRGPDCVRDGLRAGAGQLRQVAGTAGYLSEWELKGALSEGVGRRARVFRSGDLEACRPSAA